MTFAIWVVAVPDLHGLEEVYLKGWIEQLLTLFGIRLRRNVWCSTFII